VLALQQLWHAASTTAEAGGAAMDRTVQSILKLQDTVTEAASKVKVLENLPNKFLKLFS